VVPVSAAGWPRAWPAALAAVLLALGVWLRIAALDRGWFGIDQARDVAVALDVAKGEDWPTVGPTMRRIVRLGALNYSVWAAPYVVSRDPMAGYRFAAALGVAALLLVWLLARRLWGARAALLPLAVAAAHPVWIIDGRTAWAPAALPAAGAALLWLTLARAEPPSPRRAAAIGALLGLAVQLHLTMLAWVAALAVVALLERLPVRTLAAAAGAGLAVGFPAVTAFFGGAEHDVGVAGLTGGGGLAGIAGRGLRALMLPWSVPAAFSDWGGGPDRGWLRGAACLVIVAASGGGLLRLAWSRPRARVTRVLAAVVLAGAGLVLAVPGEVWWYYLDALLPACALAAGGLALSATGGLPSDREAPPDRLAAVALAAVPAAALVLAVQLGGWLEQVGAHGFMPVDPALLTLDERPGADAASRARMVTVGVKRQVAGVLAETGGDFADLWGRLHGPAFDDATGDNGFWLRWQLAERASGMPPATGGTLHVGIWYADDPRAPAPGGDDAGGATTVRVGPLLLARYQPTIDYASCRGDGSPVAVPLRVVPHPKRYGDGRPERPRTLPRRIECDLLPGAGEVRVVARLDGAGTVRVVSQAGAGERAEPGPESARCLRRTPAPRSVVVEIDLPAGAESALDLYDVPSGSGCAPDRPVV
jgi:hypothetical protein